MNLKWARSCTLTITYRNLTIHGRGPINRPHRHYVKRPHPHLRAYTGRFFGEIGLGSRRRSITHGLFSIGLPSASKGICPKKPTPGRPQGSPPRVNPPPALTKIRCDSSDPRIFVRAGVVRVSGWDPCGRPEVGRSSSSTFISITYPWIDCFFFAKIYLPFPHRGKTYPYNSCRTILAPSTRAQSLPKATSLGRYFMPQSGARIRRSGSTYCKAERILPATVSGVSTSISPRFKTPTMMVLCAS